MGGSKGSSSSTSKPPLYISQHVQGILNSAQAASQKVHSDPFPGPFYAQPTPGEFGNISASKDFSRGLIGSGNDTIQYGEDVLGGRYLDPSQNQPFQDYLKSSIYYPMYNGLISDVLPAINSVGIQKGAYGGSRNAVANVNAYRDTARITADEAARAGMSLYGMERGFMENAPTTISSGIQLNAAPYQALQDLGAYERGLNQIPIDESKAAWEESNIAPFRPLITYSDILAQLSGGVGGSSVTTNTPGSSRVAGGITGGLGGAASGAMVGSFGGPVGTAVGAGVGALLGILGGAL